MSAPYDPTIDPVDFSHLISNRYYTLAPGMIAGYEKKTQKGITRIRIEVTGETKTVMGVTTLVIRDQQWLNGRLVEDTREWVAQDKDGNVWHFGESVDQYENGRLTNHDGSWEAGVDGAKPGILMLSNPKAGDTYRQEYHPGKAEDFGDRGCSRYKSSRFLKVLLLKIACRFGIGVASRKARTSTNITAWGSE